MTNFFLFLLFCVGLVVLPVFVGGWLAASLNYLFFTRKLETTGKDLPFIFSAIFVAILWALVFV